MTEFDNWTGVITGNVTLFTASGNIDWASLERHLDRLRGTGLVAVLANAMMAEGLHLTSLERCAVLRFVVEKMRDEMPVIGTIYGVNTHEAAEEAYQSARVGAQGLLIFPHPAFAGVPLDPELTTNYSVDLEPRIATDGDIPLAGDHSAEL